MDLKTATALVRRQKDVFDTATERQGQPRPSDLPTRAELLETFQAVEKEHEQDSTQEPHPIIVTRIYPPCTKPLAELEDIAIDDLRLETVHYGKRLVLRTIGHPKNVDGVMNAVEDAHGTVDRLVVYYYGKEFLRKGQLVAVKEPFCRLSDNGGCMIRVDHPGNIIVLHESHEIVPKTLRHSELDSLTVDSAQMSKEKGNASYREADYAQAVWLYSEGLKACCAQDTIKYDLHRNRAMANIHLGRHESALQDAKAALIPTKIMSDDVKKMNGKAYYRAGRAAYHLERYASAASLFENVLELDPKDKDAHSQLRRTNARLDQQASGKYDFELMTRKISNENQPQVLDCASFTSNVEIKETAEKGRGLFATCDMEVGELVMCEKAFCVAGLEEEAVPNSIVNLQDNTIQTGTDAARLVKVLQKLLHSPRQADHFYELHDGGYQPRPSPTPVDGVVPVDTFQVIKSLQLNGFACSSLASSITTEGEDVHTRPTGVWLMSSALNHDCIGNVSRNFIGDVLLVRANRHISAGEELTMRYVSSIKRIVEFHNDLKTTWDFQCSCKLCVAELRVPPYQRNMRASNFKLVTALMEDHPVLDFHRPSMETIKEVEVLCNRIRSTYSETLFAKLPRTMLNAVDLWLCMAYATHSMGDAMLDTARVVLRDLGLGISEHEGSLSIDRTNARLDSSGINAGMYAAQIELAKGRDAIARQYEDLAKELYLLFAGSMHGFEDLFPSAFN
ncbi:hypothetical protein CERZMDRAFT_36205 [Cercospora zeae-maydis SCOH1-5]|uniref:SET domain-containing protein n=1 Tax=Cercospora zeae-maydis SCOH1-5 TaxID=717836 RepID=A0A6A6FPJ1_9PEZI|nr:hypothetical protein CERZMDRAFT_36205 [Cercospora zeae-maydis SCOH1-5]